MPLVATWSVVALLAGLFPLKVGGLFACTVPTPPCDTCGVEWLTNNDCTRFTICFRGTPYYLDCPTGARFSMYEQQCVPETDTHRLQNCDDSPPTTTPTPTIADACGLKISTRIFGGLGATPNEWQWMVSLQNDSAHFCGAVHMGQNWVVTAAHCVFNLERRFMTILFGVHDLTLPESSWVRRTVETIFVNPAYFHGLNFPNDIALIKLNAAPVGSASFEPVCLPLSTDNFSGSDTCWLTGWGEASGSASWSVLNELQMTITSKATCRINWGSYIMDSHLCLGDGTEGPCFGDSGSPLVCMNSNGRFSLAGVTSWGAGSCDALGYPAVLTKASDFASWIADTIEFNP